MDENKGPLNVEEQSRLILFLKFIYSEKATNFCEISTVDFTGTT